MLSLSLYEQFPYSAHSGVSSRNRVTVHYTCDAFPFHHSLYVPSTALPLQYIPHKILMCTKAFFNQYCIKSVQASIGFTVGFTELTSLSFNFKDFRIFPWCKVSEVRAVDF